MFCNDPTDNKLHIVIASFSEFHFFSPSSYRPFSSSVAMIVDLWIRTMLVCLARSDGGQLLI